MLLYQFITWLLFAIKVLWEMQYVKTENVLQ